MSKVIINGSAGGPGSDECTARLSDVPAGLKAVTADSNDEAGVGTMTMTGNAQAGHVLAGETFYTNDYKAKQTGTLQTMAGKTITPGAAQQSAGCAGKYMAGDIIVPGFAMPAASQIKKGTAINIYGRTVVGTFEGYVPTPTDLYLRGNNILNFQGDPREDGISFESGGIYFPLNRSSYKRLWTYNAVNFTGYSKLNVEFVITKLSLTASTETVQDVKAKFFYKRVPPPLLGNDGELNPDFRASYGGRLSINTVATLSFDIILPSITSFGITMECDYYPRGIDWEGYIYRIWLS